MKQLPAPDYGLQTVIRGIFIAFTILINTRCIKPENFPPVPVVNSANILVAIILIINENQTVNNYFDELPEIHLYLRITKHTKQALFIAVVPAIILSPHLR